MLTSVSHTPVYRYFRAIRRGLAFTLLEMAVVLFIGSMVMVATVRQKTNELYEKKAEAQGKALLAVANGVSQYVALTSGLLLSTPTVAGVVDPLKPTITELIALGYLPQGQSVNDLYGGNYGIDLKRLPSGCVSNCTGVTGYAYITGNINNADGANNTPAIVSTAMLAIGGDAGTSTEAAPNNLVGISNAWSDVGNNPRGNVAGVLVARVGRGSGSQSGIIAWQVNAIGGTTYTTVSSDAGKVLTFNNASSITLTVANLPDGAAGMIEQLGAGVITIQASAPLAVRHVAGLTKTAGQYSRVYYRVNGNDLILTGDLSS